MNLVAVPEPPSSDISGSSVIEGSSSTAVVSIVSASKSFGPVTALDGLDLSIEKGRISVLLGPNGAGKTTAIRMITGALSPDTGSARVFGLDPAGPDGQTVRRRCGVVSAKPSLYDRLSGWDNLRYAAELYDLGRGTSTDGRIREAAAMFGIEGSLDHQVGGYSTGMKTRLALSRSVLHDPDLLLLDEPTSGLDPESAFAVLELIRTMTREGQTVLMCTHLLLEAEGLADEIVVMQKGTTLLAGVPDELAADYWPTPQVRLSSPDHHALESLRNETGVTKVELASGSAVVDVDDHDRIPQLVAALVAAGAPVTGVVPFAPTLEDLYFAVRRDRGDSEGQDDIRPPEELSGRPARTLPEAA